MLFNGFKWVGWSVSAFQCVSSFFEMIVFWAMPFFSDAIAPQRTCYFYSPAFKQSRSAASPRTSFYSSRDPEKNPLYFDQSYNVDLLLPKKPIGIAPNPYMFPVQKPITAPSKVIGAETVQSRPSWKGYHAIALICSIGVGLFFIKENVKIWRIAINNGMQRRTRKKILKKLQTILCQGDNASLMDFIQEHLINNKMELLISETLVLAQQSCKNNDLAAVKKLMELNLWPQGLSIEQYFHFLEDVAMPQKMEFFSFFFDHHVISEAMLASSNEFGESLLHIAAKNHDVALAQCICQHFPQGLLIPLACPTMQAANFFSPRSPSNDFGIIGDTALHYAVRNHDERLIELFLKSNSAALQVKNSHEESPLRMILENAFEEGRCNQEKMSLSDILPQLMPVIDRHQVQCNIFYWAHQKHCRQLALCLIQTIPHAKFLYIKNFNCFPLHWAAKNNQKDLLEPLYLSAPEVLFFPMEDQPNLLAWLIAHQKFDLFHQLFDWASQSSQLNAPLPALFLMALRQQNESILSLISPIFFERALHVPELATYIPEIFSGLLTKEKGAEFFQFIHFTELRKWAQSKESTVLEKVIAADHVGFLKKIVVESPFLISEINLKTGQNALHFSAMRGRFYCFSVLSWVANPHDFVVRDAQEQTVLMLFLQQALKFLEEERLDKSKRQARNNSDNSMDNLGDFQQFSAQQVETIKKLFDLHAHHDPFFQTLSEQFLHFGLKHDLPQVLKLFFSNEKTTIDWEAMIDHRSLLEHLIQKKNSECLLMALNHHSFKPQVFFLKENSENTFAERILDLAIEKNKEALSEKILPSSPEALKKDTRAVHIDFTRQREGKEKSFLFSAFKNRRLNIFKKILQHAPLNLNDFQRSYARNSPLVDTVLRDENNRDYLAAIMAYTPLIWNIQDSNGNSLLHLVFKARGRQLVQLFSNEEKEWFSTFLQRNAPAWIANLFLSNHFVWKLSNEHLGQTSEEMFPCLREQVSPHLDIPSIKKLDSEIQNKQEEKECFSTFLQRNAPAWIEDLFLSNHFVWKLSNEHLGQISEEMFQCLRDQVSPHLDIPSIKELDWEIQNKQGESALSILFNAVLLEHWAFKRFLKDSAEARKILNGTPLSNLLNRLPQKVAPAICFKEFFAGYQRFLDHDSNIFFSHKGLEKLQNFFEPEHSCNLFLLLGGLRNHGDNTVFSILTPKERRELYLLADRLNQVRDSLSRSFLYSDPHLFLKVWSPIFDQSPLSVFSDEFSLNGLDRPEKEALYQLFLEGQNPLGHHDDALLQLQKLFENAALETLERLLKGYPQIMRIEHSHLRQNALHFVASTGDLERLRLVIQNLSPQERNLSSYHSLFFLFLSAKKWKPDIFISDKRAIWVTESDLNFLEGLLFVPTHSEKERHVNEFIIDCLLDLALTRHYPKLFQHLYGKFTTQIDLDAKYCENQSALEYIVDNYHATFIENILTVFEKTPLDSQAFSIESVHQTNIIKITELLKKRPMNNHYSFLRKSIFQDCPQTIQFIIEKASWIINRLSIQQKHALLQDAITHDQCGAFKSLLSSDEIFKSLVFPDFSGAITIIRLVREHYLKDWIKFIMTPHLFDGNIKDKNNNTFVHLLFQNEWFELFYKVDPENFSTLDWDKPNRAGVSPKSLWMHLLEDQLYEDKNRGILIKHNSFIVPFIDESRMKNFLFHQLKKIEALDEVPERIELCEAFLMAMECTCFHNQSVGTLERWLRILKLRNQFGLTIEEFSIRRTDVESDSSSSSCPNFSRSPPPIIDIDRHYSSWRQDFVGS